LLSLSGCRNSTDIFINDTWCWSLERSTRSCFVNTPTDWGGAKLIALQWSESFSPRNHCWAKVTRGNAFMPSLGSNQWFWTLWYVRLSGSKLYSMQHNLLSIKFREISEWYDHDYEWHPVVINMTKKQIETAFSMIPNR
jgi:hypothetical protein